MSLWTTLSERITTATGRKFVLKDRRSVGGGCINSAYRLQGDDRSYFVKVNNAQGLDMFAAEAAGLQEIIDIAGAPRAPRPVCWGEADRQAYLVLEYVPLGSARPDTMAALGRQLAIMHQADRPYFGWRRDNTIGSTPQINTRCDDWVEFWRKQRLGFQLDLAVRNGYGERLRHKGERLAENLAVFFSDYRPEPALLHGDLWGGNAASDDQGQPVIFDPAVYYGDREADLAMTELFGGFSARFYDAYRETCPLDLGYNTRRTLYNLYHILNHLNLFGRGYLGSAENMLDSLLSELG